MTSARSVDQACHNSMSRYPRTPSVFLTQSLSIGSPSLCWAIAVETSALLAAAQDQERLKFACRPLALHLPARLTRVVAASPGEGANRIADRLTWRKLLPFGGLARSARGLVVGSPAAAAFGDAGLAHQVAQ